MLNDATTTTTIDDALYATPSEERERTIDDAEPTPARSTPAPHVFGKIAGDGHSNT